MSEQPAKSQNSSISGAHVSPTEPPLYRSGKSVVGSQLLKDLLVLALDPKALARRRIAKAAFMASMIIDEVHEPGKIADFREKIAEIDLTGQPETIQTGFNND